MPAVTSAWLAVVSHRLEEISICSDELEAILSKERKRLKAHADEVAAMPDPTGDRFYLFEDLAEDWDRLDNTIPSLVRAALFARVVSEFEMTLLSLAKRHIARFRLRFDLKDLRDDGLKKARLFFVKFTDVGFPDTNDLWEEITKLADLRNVVLHNESRISREKRGEFQKYLAKWAGAISWDESGRVTFGPSAVPMLVTLYQQFLQEFSRKYKNA